MIESPDPETKRLVFRRPCPDDFADCLTLWSEPAVIRHFGRGAYTGEETWSRLVQKIGQWTAFGYGYWMLRDRDSGRFVGEAGFATLKRDIEPALDPVPEAGWVLSPWAHGKGYAFEAMQAALAWLEARHGHRRTTAIIDPDNGPSLQLAGRLGYRETRRALYRERESIILER